MYGKQTKKNTAIQNQTKTANNKHNLRQISHKRHQHDTDDGGQAMGEELRHAQMSRWSKQASTQVKEASSNKVYEAKSNVV